MNWGQALPLGDSGHGKSAIVSAELATHKHTQTYEIGVSCYGPSPARSPLPGLQPGVFRNRCIKHIFLKCNWWLGCYSWLQCTDGPNPSHTLYPCHLPYDFAVLPTEESEYISLALDDDGFSHVSCFANGILACAIWPKARKVDAQSFLLPYAYAITTTQASLLVPGEDKRH